jgi:hypothetical protein
VTRAGPVQIDFRRVQATVVSLYKCPIARHVIFAFGAPDAARAFLRELGPRLTMADFRFESTPDPLVNIGLTCGGLEALGTSPELVRDLDLMYQRGPDPMRLGDVPGTSSDPSSWWEGRFATEEIHCIVHLYFRDPDAVEPSLADVRALASRFGLRELIPRADGEVLEGRSLGGHKVHFGYTDGISHPDISWDDVPDTPTEVNFRNFLLGYATDEYRSEPGDGPAADLVRDSFYGVFRWIYQDVAAFNRFLRDRGPELSPSNGEELLAAKLMGRWRDGTPLVLSPDESDPDNAQGNDFGYANEDPDGLRCPFSAHIRVVNPRDQPLDEVVGSAPRIIRRGMPYGPPLDSTVDDGQDRGLIGMFLCADIRRQVYTLTGWITRNDFSPVYAGNPRVQDPLAANRGAPGASPDFIVPTADGDHTVTGLPDFVRTKGTAFLLYPSAPTLRQLAGPM